MKESKKLLFVTFILLIGACNQRLAPDFIGKESSKLTECRNKWSYKDLSKEMGVRVLLFTEKEITHGYISSNFIIGVSSNLDTIGFMDKDFEGRLKKNDLINLLPFQWSEMDKEKYIVGFRIHKNVMDNNLYCNVKTIYRCRIVLATR
jgi:hypothetical protein